MSVRIGRDRAAMAFIDKIESLPVRIRWPAISAVNAQPAVPW
jgi:hypothetical protein